MNETENTSPSSAPTVTPAPTPVTPTTPAFPQGGLTPDAKSRGLYLKARIQSGENVPLDEIREFLATADFDLEKAKSTRVNPVKKEDVDFF